MKLDSRIIDTIRRTLQIYDQDEKIVAEDLLDLKVLKLSNLNKGKQESDISLIGLGKLGMIEHLSLTGFNLGEDELDEIASIKMLKSLSLNDCKGEIISLPNLARVTITGGGFEQVLFDKLPKDYLIENYLGKDIFNYLDSYDSSTLQNLTLIGCNINNANRITDFKGMKRLALYENRLPENIESYLETVAQNGVNVINERQYKPVLDGR